MSWLLPFNNFFLSGDSLHNEGGARQGLTQAALALPKPPRTVGLARHLLAAPGCGGQASFRNSAEEDWDSQAACIDLEKAGNVLSFREDRKLKKNLGWSSARKADVSAGRKSLSQMSNGCRTRFQLS